MSTIDTSPAALRALADYWDSNEPMGLDPRDDVLTKQLLAETEQRMTQVVATLRAVAAEKEAAPELLTALSGLLLDIEALVRQSEGVAGLHLNGDVAPWADLLPGGRYEAWLATVADARSALAKVEGLS